MIKKEIIDHTSVCISEVMNNGGMCQVYNAGYFWNLRMTSGYVAHGYNIR